MTGTTHHALFSCLAPSLWPVSACLRVYYKGKQPKDRAHFLPLVTISYALPGLHLVDNISAWTDQLLLVISSHLGSTDYLGSMTSTADPAFLWRQEMQSPEISRSETHSPRLAQLKGLGGESSSNNNSSANLQRNTSSMPASPMFGGHSDHLSHIWAPSVSSPSQDFPRSPSPLFNLPSHSQPHQSHSSPLYQSLTPSQNIRSPLSTPSTLRHDISESLGMDEPLRSAPVGSQNDLDYGLASDDMDDRSSQLKSVLNAALDAGEDERIPTAVNARSPLFQTKFAPPQRSSSTPPMPGPGFPHSRNPPGLSADSAFDAAQSDMDFGMRHLQLGNSVCHPFFFASAAFYVPLLFLLSVTHPPMLSFFFTPTHF